MEILESSVPSTKGVCTIASTDSVEVTLSSTLMDMLALGAICEVDASKEAVDATSEVSGCVENVDNSEEKDSCVEMIPGSTVNVDKEGLLETETDIDDSIEKVDTSVEVDSCKTEVNTAFEGVDSVEELT